VTREIYEDAIGSSTGTDSRRTFILKARTANRTAEDMMRRESSTVRQPPNIVKSR
jgi:hypothetical protein